VRRRLSIEAAVVFLAPAAARGRLRHRPDTVAMSLHQVDQFGHFKAFRGLANYVNLFFA
jgi:hypothetical protein